MIFGQYEYVVIDINKLVVLPQVRKIKNSKIDEMADSIEDRGLINPLDVARLSKDELLEHISFINQLWKKNIDINSFEELSGFYYVIIAGHSRLEALKRNAKIYNRSDEVAIKIHPVKTSEEILAIQLDENIHSEPRIEERAIAIIETYQLGILNKKWNNKEEFIAENKNKFSRRILNDALVFADLPVEIQEFVFKNNIPYIIGVELGRLKPLIEKYELEFDKITDTYDFNIKIHYATLLTKLQKAKSIKRGLSIISAHRNNLNDYFRPKEDLQQEMLDILINAPEIQRKMHQDYLVSEYNKAHKVLKSMPFEYFTEFLALDTNLTGKDHSYDIQSIKKLYNQYEQKHFNENNKFKK